MGIKYHSSDGRTDMTMAPIGTIPLIHGRYMFNPNTCLIPGVDVKGGGWDAYNNWIGPDKCVPCGPAASPLPPPPPPAAAEHYGVITCLWVDFGGGVGGPQGCWYWNFYVNWDGPPPMTFVTSTGSPGATLYEGYTAIWSTSYGYDINGVSTPVGSLEGSSGSIYTLDPANPTAPASFNYDATQQASNNLLNSQIAAAHAALGIP